MRSRFRSKFVFSLSTGLLSALAHTASLALPSLGDNFSGGIIVNQHPSQSQATLKLSDTVEVSGEIAVNTADVGKTADIFVYAEATLPPAEDLYYFMLGEGLSITLWNLQPTNLVAFIPDVTLTGTQEVSMYSGHFIYPGTLKVYFGYRLADGTLVKNSQPIDITINSDTTTSSAQDNEPTAFAGTLAAHNAWRQKVGVPDLTWSEAAAQVAQAWADHQKQLGCPMAHNPNNKDYGENVYWASGFTPKPKDVVDAWASEIADYDYATNTCHAGKVCGHYTQVVWRNTQKVGCGTASCSDGSIFWVCNYDPPGNYVGEKPY